MSEGDLRNGPRTWIVGNIDQPDLVVDLLEVSGVDRRK
jgi:hypothetical protein